MARSTQPNELPSLAATIQGTGPRAPVPPKAPVLAGAPAVAASISMRGRTTVLPLRRAEDPVAVHESQPRFDHLRTLGQGAMGHVELVHDNDIHRTVAVKRMRKGTESDDALLRFADEVRIVGQLEHPAIVPIYDVGRGEDGHVYLVMKYLQGQTMEQIIDRLKAGDRIYHERYTPEHRVRLFLSLLDAMNYAHARGVLHRDIKPANVMIGPYGEVTVMDWGIAKPIAEKVESLPADPLAHTLVEARAARLLESQSGSITGSPLYMSPEQAAGSEDLDERSDVYSLCVLFYEWLVLRHPLAEKRTVTEVIASLVSHDYAPQELAAPARKAKVPTEYIWIIARGLVRDRERRFQTVRELETVISQVQDGKIRVQCEITFAKSHIHRLLNWIDRHADLYMVLFRVARALWIVGLAAAIGTTIWKLAT